MQLVIQLIIEAGQARAKFSSPPLVLHTMSASSFCCGMVNVTCIDSESWFLTLLINDSGNNTISILCRVKTLISHVLSMLLNFAKEPSKDLFSTFSSRYVVYHMWRSFFTVNCRDCVRNLRLYDWDFISSVCFDAKLVFIKLLLQALCVLVYSAETDWISSWVRKDGNQKCCKLWNMCNHFIALQNPSCWKKEPHIKIVFHSKL